MRRMTVLLLVLNLVWIGRADSQTSCLEFDAVLEDGATLNMELVDELWLDPVTDRDAVYRVEVQGAEGVNIEVVTTWSEWDPDCRNPNSPPIMTTEATTVEWTSPSNDAIRLVGTGNEPILLSIAMTKLASPPAGTVLTVPAVAHLPGVGGTFFRTDLRIFNPEPQAVEVELVFTPSDSTSEEIEVVVVGPAEVLRLDDVVFAVFGYENARGGLHLRMESPYSAIRAITRTYNRTESGTYGQFIEAEHWDQSLGSLGDSKRVITHLAESDAFRSNVGFIEVIGLDAVLDLELIAADGTVTKGSITIPAWTHRQINGVFGTLGAESSPSATLVVQQASEARVFTYGSIVDNLSSDPIYSRGLFPEFGARRLVIPAVASNPGRFGTMWQSDIRVVPDGGASTVAATFHPADGTQPVTKTYLFREGREIVVHDVVSDMGAEGTGALWLETASGRLAATSRTYTVTTGGTYGQFIPADSPLAPTTTTIIGVDGSLDQRTNVGLFNPWDSDSTVTIRLFTGQGSLLGSHTLVLSQRRHHQINDIFRALGVAPQMNCRIDIAGDPLGVLGYASVIDNHSGDAIYIPARRIRDFE